MTYRLSVTLHDNRVLNEFSSDRLSDLAWEDEYPGSEPNTFNARGHRLPWTVRKVSITGDEPPTKARAAFYRRWRS